MDVIRLQNDAPIYPHKLQFYLGSDRPAVLNTIGNGELLKSDPLALFCSNKCPGSLILRTYDLAQRLREAGTSVISGFHSPVERECLNILLRGRNPIIVCPARGLERMRIPKDYYEPIEQGRLLLLSSFSERVRRADARTAATRNLFVAALADEVFVAHAEPGSKTAMLCRHVVNWGKKLHTFEDSANQDLLALGATQLNLSS